MGGDLGAIRKDHIGKEPLVSTGQRARMQRFFEREPMQ